MSGFNLASLLIDHPFADDEDLVHTVDRSVTAGWARTEARRVAEELARAGVGPGRAVAVQLPNGPDAVTAMAGVWLAGAVFVPVNVRAPGAEVGRIASLTGVAARLTAGGLSLEGGERVYEDGTGFVLWTSGTTGAPKPIFHRHDAYLEILDRVLLALRPAGAPARRPPPNLIPFSLAQNAGIYNTLFALRAGAAIVIMERFDTAGFAALIARFGIRSTVLPPAAIAMLNGDAAVTDLAPLRYVRSLTAPLSPLQARRFLDKFGVFVLNGYGQTEIGEVIGWTAEDARSFPEKLGAVGRPHPGVDIRIGNPDADGAGRLLVRPPNRAIGLEERVDDEGFVDTGDVARIDEDGFVWIEGRVSDVINRGGNKVFPAEVEEVLRLCPGVEDAAVVGVADERLGEVPVAFVTGAAPADADLDAQCRAVLAPYKVPVAYHRLDALPRSEAGKVLRAELARAHPAP
ncbi:MAG TPA: AMP-binding protein [Acidimicrobiales bacterium]|nr:AMP-binding protein [Acidimicrobiales bacterium]